MNRGRRLVVWDQTIRFCNVSGWCKTPSMEAKANDAE